MSFRRVGWVAAIALATVLEISCGQVYRPVVIPINNVPPNPQNFHAVFGISTNAAYNPGTALQIDVSGDTIIGEANMGVNPTHAAILPNHSRVFVASAGSLFAGETDVVTAFFPAGDSSIATGLSTATTFTLPNVGANQTSGILSISEAGSVVTMILSAPLINPQVGGQIVVSGVVIPCQNPPGCTIPKNPSAYDGNFSITSVNGTTIQYMDCQLVGSVCVALPPVTTPGGSATIPVPLFCSYQPDYVTTSQNNAVYVANYGQENGANCDRSSTDSIAALNPGQNTITNIQYLPAGSHPVAMVETPNGENLYVVNQGTNSVANLSPIDLSTQATISVGNTPVWAVSRVDGLRVYVLAQGSGTLIPIDTATNTVLPSQTNFSVGAGANSLVYDPNLNRLYVTNPNNATVYVFSTSGGVDLSGTANDTPTLLSTILMTAGSNPPCPAGCSPQYVAPLPDGSRFYVASFATQTPCTDPNLGAGDPCIVPMVTVFDALNFTAKPVPSSRLSPPSSLSLLTSPQFAATQFAVPPVTACIPAASYAPGSTRFRMFATASADSSHVYVSICDASSIADINTTTNTISTSGNNTPDTLVTNITPEFAACATASCSSVVAITAFSISSNNVVTFTAANSFTAGQRVTISGFTSKAGTTYLNGLTLTVLGTGLTGAQFECNLPTAADTSLTTDFGTAVPLPPPQTPGFLLTGQ
jgi:DNA-binding beta-propeller fold protein YncE